MAGSQRTWPLVWWNSTIYSDYISSQNQCLTTLLYDLFGSWGAPTERAEMPYWHFTSDLQLPTPEAVFISDRRLSLAKKLNSVWCLHLLNNLLCPDGRGTGSRGMSVRRRTKLCPHPWGERNHTTQIQWKISNESVSFSSSIQSQRRESPMEEPHGEVQGWFLWNSSWKGFVTILVPHP